MLSISELDEDELQFVSDDDLEFCPRTDDNDNNNTAQVSTVHLSPKFTFAASILSATTDHRDSNDKHALVPSIFSVAPTGPSVVALGTPREGSLHTDMATPGSPKWNLKYFIHHRPDLALRWGRGELGPLVRIAKFTTPLYEDIQLIALKSIFHALGGADWTDNANWLDLAKPLNEWVGVTADHRGRWVILFVASRIVSRMFYCSLPNILNR